MRRLELLRCEKIASNNRNPSISTTFPLPPPKTPVKMLAVIYTAVYVGVPFLYMANAHNHLHGTLNLPYLSLSLFLCINILICLWEMTLFISRKLIKKQFEEFKKKFAKEGFPSPVFLFEDVSFRDAISMEYWSRVWSTYSMLDPRFVDC